MEQVVRTAADYETLRRFIIEGGETHSSIERELSVFIAHGAAAWILQNQDRHDMQQSIWSKPYQRYYAENLAVLLANMVEG